MTGPEIENSSLAQAPAAARPELLALVPGLEEHDGVRLRNREDFVVHLRLLDVELGRDPFGDRMLRELRFDVAGGPVGPPSAQWIM